MAMTKKELYKKYGIEYDTDTEKILSPIGWIKPLLKEGNDKTGKRCRTFSMQAGTAGTCICDCDGCYAKTGCFNFKSVKESNRVNQYLVENHLDFVKRAILAQIEADKIQLVRIHASGDFNTKNSKDYADMWVEIVSVHSPLWFGFQFRNVRGTVEDV